MIVVTGATGQLGRAFAPLLPGARFLTRDDLDLRSPEMVAPLLASLAPTGLINCAAYTAVDRAEEELEAALLVNAVAVDEMAHYAASASIPFVTYSTDYVFDGTAGSPYLESSPTAPVNAYGATKLEGERRALATHRGTLVIRTSWLVSATPPNFVTTMLRLAAERDEVRVVDDQVGCPTIAADLAAATLEAVAAGATGVLHLTNQGSATWFELAQAAVELGGGDPGRIRPCSTSEYPTPARRPAYSVLGSERLEGLGLAPLPPWRVSLERVVADVAAG